MSEKVDLEQVGAEVGVRDRILIGKTFYPVEHTPLAAALMTLGVGFADKDAPVSNVYETAGECGRGRPGRVTYNLAGSSAGGVTTQELCAAWDAGCADEELDALVERIAEAVPELGAELRRLLPLALMVYGRGFLENRERILDLWRRAVPMVHVRKGENSFALISPRASRETLRKLGGR